MKTLDKIIFFSGMALTLGGMGVCACYDNKTGNISGAAILGVGISLNLYGFRRTEKEIQSDRESIQELKTSVRRHYQERAEQGIYPSSENPEIN